MPGMSGTMLLQLAKAFSPRTRRIMLTGYPGETLLISAGEVGLRDLVGKPWDDEALKGLIRNRLASSEPE
jgi:response regulator RpfG family c-di-GMP phosphodiesterase